MSEMRIPEWLRPTLERVVKADASMGATAVEICEGWKAMDELRALLRATAAPTVKAEQGTTSDQYRAELYDEVWEKVRDMGYGNVTDALVELERMKAAPSLPAAGSVVEDGPDITTKHGYPAYSVAQHERIVAALSAQQSAQPEFCCEHSYKVAKQAAWGALDLTQCECDHNEYCEHCWPDDFREGGKWHGGFEKKQSAPERVSVPVELLRRVCWPVASGSDRHTHSEAVAELRALLASHQRGEA